jgi:hypothetical protein
MKDYAILNLLTHILRFVYEHDKDVNFSQYQLARLYEFGPFIARSSLADYELQLTNLIDLLEIYDANLHADVKYKVQHKLHNDLFLLVDLYMLNW